MPFRFRLPGLTHLARPAATRAPEVRSQQRDRVPLQLDDGRSVDVLRVRDPRARRIKLSVSERGVRLTLPQRASLLAGERFLIEHRDWLHAQLDQLVNADDMALHRDESTSLPLRGASVPLRWERGRFTAIQRDSECVDSEGLVFQTTARAGDAAMHRALRDFYEAQARADIGRWIPLYLPSLPRAPRRVQLKVMSSQWGSLAPDGTVALDLSLVLAPPAAFEYVLVHELCHLIHHDHSPAYWREVEKRFPEWRDQREYFRSEGRRLKATLQALLR
jgi:predicted metal-dependent hydrolase